MWQGQTEMDDLSIVICRLAGYQTCFVLRTPATHVIGLDSSVNPFNLYGVFLMVKYLDRIKDFLLALDSMSSARCLNSSCIGLLLSILRNFIS